MIMISAHHNVHVDIMKGKRGKKTYTKARCGPVTYLEEKKKNFRYLSHVKCVDLLLKVLEQNNATKVPRLLYLGWMYSLWPIMKGPAYRCASTKQHWWPTHTHTHRDIHTHTYTGQAAARLSSPKIIRHQNEFPCFFFSPLLVHFIHVLELGRLANAVNMLSSWIFITPLHGYITRAGELRLQGCHQHAHTDRNTHTNTHTRRNPRHT